MYFQTKSRNYPPGKPTVRLPSNVKRLLLITRVTHTYKTTIAQRAEQRSENGWHKPELYVNITERNHSGDRLPSSNTAPRGQEPPHLALLPAAPRRPGPSGVLKAAIPLRNARASNTHFRFRSTAARRMRSAALRKAGSAAVIGACGGAFRAYTQPAAAATEAPTATAGTGSSRGQFQCRLTAVVFAQCKSNYTAIITALWEQR